MSASAADVLNFAAEIASLRERVEQLDVQLAGCLVAAEGPTFGGEPAKQGDYGWSLAYQRTLDLHRRCQEAEAAPRAPEAGLREAQWNRARAWAEQAGECVVCGAEVCRGVAHNNGCVFLAAAPGGVGG